MWGKCPPTSSPVSPPRRLLQARRTAASALWKASASGAAASTSLCRVEAARSALASSRVVFQNFTSMYADVGMSARTEDRHGSTRELGARHGLSRPQVVCGYRSLTRGALRGMAEGRRVASSSASSRPKRPQLLHGTRSGRDDMNYFCPGGVMVNRRAGWDVGAEFGTTGA